jgi:hemerythrin-like metal-binding protein
MKFIWDAKYSVSIKSIDTQHQRFFEICNEINYLIRQHQTDEKSILEVVKELFDYAENHLSYEEKYFKDLNYPQAAAHIAAHNSFRQKIAQYSHSPENANAIADFARDWLSDHILAVDHQYSQFFLAHDVK